jgi:peptidoglycan/xylan/chitin deacetylase (PgdA/CDA1 family)
VITPETCSAPVATIVVYHVVRQPGGLTARLKGLEIDAFRGQLDYIRGNYTPVGLFDLVAAARGGAPLPPRPITLTFDDGYAGQYDVVFPLLCDTRTPAAFFPAASSMLDGHVLDVNKIQLILAGSRGFEAVVAAIDAAINREARAGGPPVAAYRAQWWVASRWDPEPVVYIKRLLQHALPERMRRMLIDDLFRRLVSADERDIAAELYMTGDQVRDMCRAGMTIGAHGDRHLRLSTLSRADQAVEIDGALRVLEAVGLARRDFAYCYANGEYNNDTIDLLRARQCAVGLTIRAELARLVAGDLLTLPRLDTNDLPVRSDAGPAEWTRRVDASAVPR